MTLPNISPETIQAYQNEIAKTSSEATAKRKTISLNRFFDWAQGAGHLTDNPLTNKQISKSTNGQNANNPTDQIVRIRKHTGARTFAVIGMTTGMMILLFLLVFKLRLPIPFITNFAQEAGLQTQHQSSEQNGAGQAPTASLPANSAVNGAWNLYAKLKLASSTGTPLVGSQTLNFKLFDSAKDGVAVYTSPSQTITTDTSGSALISLDNVPTDLFFKNNTLYLEPQIGSASSSVRIPVSTANTPANLGGFFPSDPTTGAIAKEVPIINSDGTLLLASESPAIKAKQGNFLIEGQTVTIKTADGSDGNIEFNPDGKGYAHFLFEGSRGNFLNAQGPNLTSGSLYYGMVPNNATGYDLIRLQSGAPKMTTKFAVDAKGNTTVAGNLNVAGNIQTSGVDRLTSAGALTNITGYTQSSGNFTINQKLGDTASITKTGSALSDVLDLTLDERGASHGSDYATLTLKRFNGNDDIALWVDEGNARFDGQVQLGRFVSNPLAIGSGSLIYNTTDNSVYFWNGSAWTSMGSASTVPFSGILSGTNTSAAMVVGSGASLTYTGTGTINASTLIGSTWAAPGAIGSTTPSTGAFTTLSATPTGTNDITLTTDADSTLVVSGLQSGSGSAICVDGSNNIVTCTTGSGGIAGSGTAGQIAFFNTATSITSETSGFGWDATNNLFTVSSSNTTGTTASITNTALTSGKLTSFTSTNDSAANTAWSANLISPTNAQGTTAVSTGSIAGVDLQFTQNTTVAGNTETAARINLVQNDSSSTDATVASLLDLANNDTATGNQITVTDGIKITGTNITNGINLSETFGTNLITSTNFSVTQGGLITTADDIAVNGGDLTTTAATFNVANAATTLDLGSTNVTRTVNIGTGTSADTINIGTGGTTAENITIGTTTASNSLALNDDNWNITGGGLANFVSIGAATPGTGAFTTLTSSGNTTIGTGASSVNTIGSTTTPGTLTLHGATTLDNTFSVSGSNLTSLGGDLTVTGDAAVNGGDLTSSATTFNLLNATVTTLNLAGAATTINMGPTGSGASTIAMSGGSGDTGCTLDGATGNFTCSGIIAGSAATSKWNGITNPDGNETLTMAAFTTTMGWTSTGALDAWTMNFNNNSTSSTTQDAVVINNAAVGSFTDTATENLLLVQQLDTTTAGTTGVTNAIKVDAAASSGITNGITVTNSAGNITNGINIADTAGGTLATGINFSGTFTNEISLSNGETINNVTDGTVLITSPTTQTSGNLTVAGTTGLTFSGVGGDITFTNGEKIDNDTDGSINIEATTLELTGGTTIHSNQTTVALLNTTTTTLNLAGAATTINMGPTGSGASTIAMSGGSGDTGCTLNGATGDFTCSGTISTTGTSSGFWSRVAGNLYPSTANDTVSATTSAAVAMTITQTGAFNALLVQDAAGDTTPFMIDQSGNVGIGTTAPGAKLHIVNGNEYIQDTTNSVVQGIYLTTSDSSLRNYVQGFQTGTPANDYLQLGSQFGSVQITTGSPATPTTRVTVLTGGNVGIGDTSPAALFTVGSGDLFQVGGTTGDITFNSAASHTTELTLQNNETIDNNVDGSINLGATTLELTGVTTIHSNQTTVALLNTTTTTLNLAGAATTINFGPTGSAASTIAMSGGSGDTGCTLNGATGALTCSGDITSSGTGTPTAGFWTRNTTSGYLYPSTITDNVGIGNTAPQSNLEISDAADPTLRLSEASSTTSYSSLADLSTSQMILKKITNSGASDLIIEPIVTDGVSAATIRMFRETNTSGRASLDINLGTNSASVNTSFAGTGNSYVNANNGNLGIGTASPTSLVAVNQVTTGVGTVSNSAGGTTVTGVNTQFLNTFKIGDTITINGETVSISAIASNTSMTTEAITGANSGVVYTLTGGTRLSVMGNGLVGIGITAPTAYIHGVGSQPATLGTTPGTNARNIITLTGGIGGNTDITTTGIGGVGSALTINAGTGGLATAALTASTGGAGGSTAIASGIGGAATLSSTGTKTGGNGGVANWTSGAGGAATGADTGTNTGGNGGLVTVQAGAGGAANTGTGALVAGTGGGVNILGGTGGLGTSGTATGGNGGLVQVLGGATAAMEGAAGGGVTVSGRGGSTTGSGGNGGTLTLSGGAANGDNSANRSGGALSMGTGSARGTTAGATWSFSGGTGGSNLATGSSTGGIGGAITYTMGNGGTAPLATVLSTGGAGGTFTITGGVGGVATAAAAINNTGGNGSAFSWIAGAGGAATGASSGTNLGGTGGAITIRPGAGGAANSGSGTMTGGTGGTLTLQGGVGGVGTTTTGTGGDIIFQTAATTTEATRMTITQAGDTTFGTATTGHGLGASGDVLVSNNLELNGVLYLDGGTIADSSGVATIIFPADPAAINSPNVLDDGVWWVNNTVNNGMAALMVNQAKGGDIFTASASGVAKVTIKNDGTLVVGAGDGGTPVASTIRGAAAAGTNIAGADLTFDASNGTGNQGSGDLVFRTASPNLTLDAATSANTNPDATTLTWSHTVGTGSHTMLIVGVAVRNNRTISSITYNGVAMTFIRRDIPGTDVSSEIWYLANPAAGAHNVVVTSPVATTIEGGAISFINASATIGNNAGGTGTAVTSSSVTTTSATGQEVVDVISMQSAATITVGGSQTQEVNRIGTAGAIGMSIKAGAASVNTTWTFTSDTYASSAVAVVPYPTGVFASGSTANTLTERMRIDANGNVGIGITAPAAKLDVNGVSQSIRVSDTTASLSANDIIGKLEFYKTDASTGGAGVPTYIQSRTTDLGGLFQMEFITGSITAPVTTLTLGTTGNVGIGDTTPTEATLVVGSAGAGNIFATFATANTERLCWDASGASLITDCTGTPGDYAEAYGTSDSSIEAGDIVSADTNRSAFEVQIDGVRGSKSWVTKASSSYQNNIIGVVSTSPNETIGQNFQENENSRPVALNGRVPVKISQTSEAIKIGDPITSSDDPGKGIKSTKVGRIVGTALEDWSPNNPKSTILVFVNNIYNDPDIAMADTGDLNITQNTNGNYQLTNTANGTIIDRIGAFGQMVAAHVKTGLIETKELVVEGSVNVASNIKAGYVETQNLVAQNLESRFIKTKIISPLADGTDVTVQIGSEATPSGKFAIDNAQGTEVASIDNEGNASFNGVVHSQNIDEIQALLTNVAADQSVLSQIVNSGSFTATNSAQLDQLVASDLYITNQAAINSLSITQSLTLGSDFAIDINGINTLTSPLKLQSLATAPIELMAGLVTIDTHGNVNIAGDLYVAGKINASGLTLSQSTQIEQNATNSANLLTLNNLDGSQVASVNASGSALFNSVSTNGLIIGAADATSSGTITNGVITTNSTVGQAVVPAGTSEITIKNLKVTDYTLVYVTPTSSTENNVLYVKSKSAGQFTVGFTNPIDIDTTFNWWIVQVAQ